MFTEIRTWWKACLIGVPIGAVAGAVGYASNLDDAIDRTLGDRQVWFFWGGAVLIGVAVLISFIAVMSPPNGLRFAPAAANSNLEVRDLRTRWRLLWLVGLLGLGYFTLAHLVFALNDDYRGDDTASAPKCAVPAPVKTGANGSAAGGEAALPSGDVGADGLEPELTIDFGFDRMVKTRRVAMLLGPEGDPADVVPSDFRWIGDQVRGEPAVCVVGVVPTAGDRVSVELLVNTTKRSIFEGGDLDGAMQYVGRAPLTDSNLVMRIRTQSRVLAYLIGAMPVAVLLAIYQGLSRWPISLKRWWATIVTVAAPAATAFSVAGLRNPTWGMSITSLAGISVATYGAALAAAVASKSAGHDLGDGSAPGTPIGS